jgi:hypothetical protein
MISYAREERTRRKALPVPVHATLLDLSAFLFALLHLVRRLDGELREREKKVKIIMLMSVAQCTARNAEKSEDKNN